MLTQVVSFLRNLFGTTGTVPQENEAAFFERRGSIRYPINHLIPYERAGLGEPERYLGFVKDISLGGVKLVVQRQFPPGELLSLHFSSPHNTNSTAILACVVYVQESDDQAWALGCRFARNLTGEDLAPLFPKDMLPAGEHRAALRLPFQVQAKYQCVDSTLEPASNALAAPRRAGTRRRSACRGSASRPPAGVAGLSTTGAVLVVQQPIPAGTLLNLELLPDDGSPHSVLACVVRVTRSDDTGWIVSCNFIAERSEIQKFQLFASRATVARALL